MIKYLKPLGQFVIRVTDKIDDLCVSFAEWARLSQIRVAVWVLFIFLIYNWVAAGVEILLWGEPFEHFIDTIVVSILGFMWLSTALEIQDILIAQRLSQYNMVKAQQGQLYTKITPSQKPVNKQTCATELRSAIRECEKYRPLRVRAVDGSYYPVTNVIIDTDGNITLI